MPTLGLSIDISEALMAQLRTRVKSVLEEYLKCEDSDWASGEILDEMGYTLNNAGRILLE